MLAALAMQFMEMIAFDYAKKNFLPTSNQDMNSDDGTTSTTQPYNGAEGTQKETDAIDNEADKSKTDKPDNDIIIPIQQQHDVQHVHGHQHGMILGNMNTVDAIQKTISAYLLEFGCTSHSVIIGISVGVANNSETNTLLAALVFHQFFEGM